MKIPKQLRDSIIDIGAKIIRGGITRDASTIRVKFEGDEIKVFEKKDSDQSLKQTGYVEARWSPSIVCRLKIVGGLLISEYRKVQVGNLVNLKFGGSPNIGRKIRIISVPDFDGKEEVIIDLVP